MCVQQSLWISAGEGGRAPVNLFDARKKKSIVTAIIIGVQYIKCLHADIALSTTLFKWDFISIFLLFLNITITVLQLFSAAASATKS